MKRSLILLHIGYTFLVADMEIIEEMEVYEYGFTSFLAEFGGALGLFLGFSFYSIPDWFNPFLHKIKSLRK